MATSPDAITTPDPRRPVDRWLFSYSGDHVNPTNQLIHLVCVPAIVWSVTAALFTIPVPTALVRPGFWMGLAMFLGGASERWETVHKLWHPLSYLLFPLSGAAFLLSVMPPEAQAVLTWLPMIHGVEYLREGFFGSQITAIYDLGYMAVCNAVLTLLGLALIRIVSESVIPE